MGVVNVSSRPTRDGGPAIVTERDAEEPARIGTYVVHREGAQPGVVIELALASN